MNIENLKKVTCSKLSKFPIFVCPNNRKVFVHVESDFDVKETDLPAWGMWRETLPRDMYLVVVKNDENNTILYAEQNAKSIEFAKDLTLISFLNKIGSVGLYFIEIRYPEQTPEQGRNFATLYPVDERWSVKNYFCAQCCLPTEEEAVQYIKKRYEKEFNRTYKYILYKVEAETKMERVHVYTYEEMIGL